MDSGIVIVSALAIGIVIYFWAMSILLRYVDEHSGEKAVLWVGLTDDDLEFWAGELGQGELGKGVLRAVADYLKEKNT